MMKPSYQFTRLQRLLNASEFKNVFDQPCRSGDDYFTVLAKTNALTTARLGLIIAKKKVREAVARNRIKRLIRDSFRHHQHNLVGIDCVVLAKEGIDTLNNRTLACALTTHWQKIARRCKKS